MAAGNHDEQFLSLQLLLLRHAKSDWGDTSLDDADRPLAPRGEKAAKAIGERIGRLSLIPDSHPLFAAPGAPAIRWRSPRPNSKPGLPPGSLRIFMTSAMAAARWKSSARKAERHSASCWWGTTRPLRNWRSALSAAGRPTSARRCRQKYPTGALAVIGFNNIPWADIAEGKGRLKGFIRPRDLAAAGDA